MSQDSSQNSSQVESQSQSQSSSQFQRIVVNNPNKSYWSQMWNSLCCNWKHSSNCCEFLYTSLWDQSHIFEMTRRFETMVIMPIQAEKIPDPEFFNINDKEVDCMVIFRPFETNDKWFWAPDRIEFHNRMSATILMHNMKAAGWQLDKFLSTKFDYKTIMNKILSDSKNASECAPASSPEKAPEIPIQSENDVLQSIVNSDNLIQCLETN